MEKILRIIEKFIPRKIYTFFQPAYHMMWAILGALVYRFPSKKLVVIGVTGTKGKSSTAEILNRILEEAGYKTALSGTIRFKIADRTRPNMYKMSMPGRMFMQKFLRQAVDAGCTHAVIEMTSEGAKLFRHLFIDLDALIFLNLSPEHIESHGSYEKYVDAKVALARQLARSSKKTAIIANVDDKEAMKFLAVGADEKISYSIEHAHPYKISDGEHDSLGGIVLNFRGTTIRSPLRGVFNVNNILAAATAAAHFGVKPETIAHALEHFSEIKGRVEKVPSDLPFDIFVDYAHTADSLEKLYQAFTSNRRVCVLGSTGGGRDKWKRPAMGAVANTYCDHIVLTNEDPYDEDPLTIINEVRAGIDSNKDCEIILDRREAIAHAIAIADEKQKTKHEKPQKTVVLITGKGTDPYIMTANNGRIRWDDVTVAKEEAEKFLGQK